MKDRQRDYRAVVITDAGSAEIQRRAVPTLGAADVLVRVAYQGICGTDFEVLNGTLGYYVNGMAKYPIVPGHEFSGTVAAVGGEVDNVTVGDRVVVECIQGCGWCAECRRDNGIGCLRRREVGVINRDGGYAEFVVSPARFLHRVPDTVTLYDACLCEPLAVAAKGIRRMERAAAGRRPRNCVVIGAGCIGHLAVRILLARGYAVTVVDRNVDRARLLVAAGATVDAGVWLGKFDAVVEATGDGDLLPRIVSETAPGATILLLGFPYGPRPISLEPLVAYDKTIVGAVGSGAEDFEEALAMMPAAVSAFTRGMYAFADYAQAWRVARSGRYLKVALRIGGEQ